MRTDTLKIQILNRLDFAAFYHKEIPGLKNGNGGEAIGLCPFHEDKKPSFSVNTTTGLFNCFGCGAKGDIFTFEEKRRVCDFKTALNNLAKLAGVEPKQVKTPKRSSFTLHDFSVLKGLPVVHLLNNGLREKKGANGNTWIEFPYLDQNKTLIAVKRRFSAKEKGKFRKGDSLSVLYNEWNIEHIRKNRWCLLVEGESDVLTCSYYQIPALGLAGKNNLKGIRSEILAGLQIFAWEEPDAPELPGKLARLIPDLLVIKAPLDVKDISEAHVKGLDVVALLKELKAKAKPPGPTYEKGGGAVMPEIIITKRFLHSKTLDSIKALETANNPPFVFRRSGSLVKISIDEKDHPKISILGDMQLRGILARVAHFLKETENGPVPTSPPMDLVKDFLALGEWNFPALEGIIQVPGMRPDGTVIDSPGYDVATRLFYVKPANLSIPKIPENPSNFEVEGYLGYLLEAICDFPFVADSDRANALGLVMTLPLRPAIPGPIPLAVTSAPAPGTGKTLLQDAVATVGTGHSAPMAGCPETDDEMRKFITARLLEGAPIISFDNLDRPLGGSSLCRGLTCTMWEDRILGGNTTARLPQRAVWIANGNNVKLRGDLPRRTYPIRMDAQVVKPWERENFKHKNLIEWISSYRGGLLAAIFTLARAWFVAGKPAPERPVPVMGGFEAWAQTIGGILAFVRVDGFLENLALFHDSADLESGEWEAFLTAWSEIIGETPKTCQEVAAIVRDNSKFVCTLPGNLQDVLVDPKKSFERSLGRMLAGKERRPYGENNLALQRVGTHKRAVLWKVAPLSGG